MSKAVIADKAIENQATITFGALAPKIQDQLRDQGLESKRDVNWEEVQKDADSITRLYVCGLITDAEVRKIRYRFVSRLRLGRL